MTREEVISKSISSGPVSVLHGARVVERQEQEVGDDTASSAEAASLENDARWQTVQRILLSKTFAKTTRLSAFLFYICERTLQGRTDEITEQQIGVRVFERPAHYNPGDDNIVRGTARLLRQRLDVYYREEGQLDTLHVVVPRGGYIPIFEKAAEERPQTILGLAPAGIRAPTVVPVPSRSNYSKAFVPLLVSFVLGAAVALAIRQTVPHRSVPASPSAILWRTLFPPNKRTLIVAGDAGLNMFDNLAKRQVDADEYSARTYLSSPFSQTPTGYTWAPLATRSYVSVQDLKLIVSIVRLPEVRDDKHVFIHYARELRPEDLMDANAILIGSPPFNPWVQLFDKGLDFSMSYNGVENSITIVNRKPMKGEKSTYKWIWSDPTHAYAIIALTNNLNGTGKVLLIEGTTTIPIGAATDLLLSPQMAQILSRATRPNRSLRPFEILLETNLVGNSSMQPQIIAVHLHDQ